MGELTLLSDYSLDTTLLSNIYIDEYMADNNEAQMKIYLYLLRNLAGRKPVSVVSIADSFNYTVFDVERSLKYMQTQGLMGLTFEEDGHIASIRIKPLKARRKNESEIIYAGNLSKNNKTNMEKFDTSDDKNKEDNNNLEYKKPSYSRVQMAKFAEDEVVKRLLFVAENYMGKSLSPSDIKTVIYIYDGLSFDEDLSVYVMEYCINNGNKSLDMIEKTAVIWKKAGVNDVASAKVFTQNEPEQVKDVFVAFGIQGSNRKPSQAELFFVKKWVGEYGFSTDIICEACRRTVDKIHTVSFEYADAILKNYKKQNVKTISDIENLDETFAEGKGASSSRSKKSAPKSDMKKTNKFNNFSQREYDYEELEKMLFN